MSKHVVSTPLAPPAAGPYSQAIVVNGFVFTAGQVGIDPETKALADGLEAQTHQVLKNIRAVLEAAGTNLDNVVKTTVFLQNMGDFAAMNAIYAQYFTLNPPARSTIEVAKLPVGALIEIETVAVL